MEQLGRGHDTGQLQGDQDHRELERESEKPHHQEDQPEVGNGVVDGLELGATDGLQEGQCVGQGVIGGGRTEEEQGDGSDHERDGPLALSGLEARGDEAPELEQDDRGREHQPPEHGDLDPQRQPVER